MHRSVKQQAADPGVRRRDKNVEREILQGLFRSSDPQRTGYVDLGQFSEVLSHLPAASAEDWDLLSDAIFQQTGFVALTSKPTRHERQGRWGTATSFKFA